MKGVFRVAFAAAVMLAGFSLTIALPIAAGENESGSEVVYDVYHDTSRPVREYPDQLPLIPRGLQVKPLHQRLVPGAAVEQQDQAEQLFALPAVSANVSHNFEGMADSANGFVGLFVPPDSNLSVGATQVVEVINTAYKVFSKSSGSAVQGARQISSIFTGVSEFCGVGGSGTYTDPVVVYDKKAGRPAAITGTFSPLAPTFLSTTRSSGYGRMPITLPITYSAGASSSLQRHVLISVPQCWWALPWQPSASATRASSPSYRRTWMAQRLHPRASPISLSIYPVPLRYTCSNFT